MGVNRQGETSAYSYNALGSRYLKHDYLDIYKIPRNDWQPTWETGAGHIVQTETATYTKEYIVDYLSLANRDLMVYNEGEHIERHVYDRGFWRVSTTFTYMDDTARGQPGENIASDTAVSHTEKLIYRTNHLTSTLFAVDEDGTVALHMMYDEWGNPQVNTEFNINKSGVSNLNNYTGYTYDDVLGIYYAQNRFYDAGTKRFIQEDPIKDGMNWYAYVGNNPINMVDPTGLALMHAGENVNAKTIDGVAYASVRNLIKAYGGHLNSNLTTESSAKLPTDTSFRIGSQDQYYEGNIGSLTLRFYVRRNGQSVNQLVFYGIPSYVAASGTTTFTVRDTEFINIDDSNHISVEYFHKLMCSVGVTKKLTGLHEMIHTDRNGRNTRVFLYGVNMATEKVVLSLGNKGSESLPTIGANETPKVMINAGFFVSGNESIGWTYSEATGLYQNGGISKNNLADYNNFETLFYYKDGSSEVIKTNTLLQADVQKKTENAVFIISGTKQADKGPNDSIQRTMIGVRADGTIILLASDSGEVNSYGQAVRGGLTIPDGEQILKDLGAINILNLDGGGSTQFYYDGQMLTNPAEVSNGKGVYRNVGSVIQVYDK